VARTIRSKDRNLFFGLIRLPSGSTGSESDSGKLIGNVSLEFKMSGSGRDGLQGNRFSATEAFIGGCVTVLDVYGALVFHVWFLRILVSVVSPVRSCFVATYLFTLDSRTVAPNF
jgi:hypothetical protein